MSFQIFWNLLWFCVFMYVCLYVCVWMCVCVYSPLLLTFEAPTAPAGQKVAAKCAEAIRHCGWQVRQQIYTAIAAGSNAHCGWPGYNHEKQKNKTKTTTNKRSKNIDLSFFIYYIIQSSTSPPPLSQVSIIGEAWFIPCSHPTRKSRTDKETKKLKKETLRKFTTLSTTNCPVLYPTPS